MQTIFKHALWLLLLLPLLAGAEVRTPVSVSAQTSKVTLNQHFKYRVVDASVPVDRLAVNEPSRWLSSEELSQHNYAGTKPNIWSSVPLYNRSNRSQTFYVKFSDPFLQSVSVFVLDTRGTLLSQLSNSFSTPLMQRPHLSHEQVLPVTLPANKTVWLVTAVQQWPEQMPTISLWQSTELELRQQQQQTALGVNAGILILLALAAFVSAQLFKSRLLLTFGCVSAAFTLSLLLHSGVWITYFSPYSPDIAASLKTYVSQLLILTMAWFIWEWGRFRFRLSRFNRVGYVVLAAVLGFTIGLPWLDDRWQSVLVIAQVNGLLIWTAVVVLRSVQKQPISGFRWQTFLLAITVIVAWLLISPRYNPIWEGISGLLLYSAMTVTVMMFLLALERHRLNRLMRRIVGLKKNRKTLRRRLWQLLQRTGEGWFRLNDDGSFKQVNQQMLTILAAHSLDQVKAHWSKGFVIDGKRQLTSVDRLDGRKIWLDVEYFGDNTGRISDVTKRMEAEIHLDFLAHHDAVTGLLNVRELRRLLQSRLDAQKAACVTIIKLSGLEVIADQAGADAKDQAILQLAINLKKKAPKYSRIARVSEHEIALLNTDDEQSVFAQAHRLVQYCKEFRFNSDRRIYQITAHAGIAYSDSSEVSASTLLRQAREALKLAMQQGDYRVHSYSEADQKRLLGEAELEWEQKLKQALREENWTLYAQPIVSAARNADKHCIELLLRLPDSNTDEPIAPQQFLRAALRAGVMGKADRWLVREAVEHFNENPFEATRTWRCHINLSTQSLEDDGFIQFIEAALKNSVIQPNQLVFEVSEPDAFKHFDQTYQLFKNLKELGIGTAIDQFGSSYNSFQLLRQLPLTQIKVNRFWVQNMLIDTIDAELVASCVRLAKVANVEVCAVGVESDEVRIKLTQLGVDYIQGFVCGHPVEWQR